MARRYDSRTTIFSPEGRLYQVEYAMEAISHAGTCLGILSNEGIVLAAEKTVTSKLLEQINHEKVYRITDSMAVAVAGITSDANTLVNYSRNEAQKFLFTYNEHIPCEQLVQKLCDLKQGYTQYGGLRPYGVSFLYAGHDEHHGFQLYQSDPSGNYSGWKATCIGQNSSNAQGILKQDYKEGGMSLKEAKALAVKVLAKTMESTSLTSEKRRNFTFDFFTNYYFFEKVEFATLSLVGEKVVFHSYTVSEIDSLLKEENAQALQAEAQNST
ncbi:hypothetical protein HK099_007043 [Clydaea vesicula]|uniref:Proteasome subunit alpha type n=1 Tax=Clydaea vesicula TaxID=447962 RepID=A0AAD5U1R4_9FUNG|nr:hypothetical protein HK099_007043 [Clydaea vesicula]KAJ3396292.1 hypothetical protein HDU92_003549 [Lobulomyces angularis]